MNVKHEDCSECGSARTIVCDQDILGFDYDLYRPCLDCEATEEVGLSEVSR